MTDGSMLKIDPQFFLMRRSALNRTQSTDAFADKLKDGPDEELKRVTQQFEALLLNMMIREMRETIPDATLFPDSMEKEIFTGMLDEKIAERFAERGGIGISRMLFDQLKGK
jgi:flagellar protein FlgJ